MSEIPKEWELEAPGVMVSDPNRHNSFSSEELEVALDNSVMDSISFDPTSTTTGNTSAPPPESVKNLIRASKALRKTERHGCVYTLRRLALYFAKRDGVCETKGQFAKIYEEIKLPGELGDPEPAYENDLPGQEYVQYAHSRCKEAFEALKAARLESDDEVMKLSKCVSEIWALLQ